MINLKHTFKPLITVMQNFWLSCRKVVKESLLSFHRGDRRTDITWCYLVQQLYSGLPMNLFGGKIGQKKAAGSVRGSQKDWEEAALVGDWTHARCSAPPGHCPQKAGAAAAWLGPTRVVQGVSARPQDVSRIIFGSVKQLLILENKLQSIQL